MFWGPPSKLVMHWNPLVIVLKIPNRLNQLTRNEVPELVLQSKLSQEVKIRQCPVFRKPVLKRALSSERHRFEPHAALC